MKFLVLFSLFFVTSCGSELLDRREQPTVNLPNKELPPPIPPIYRQEPQRPPVNLPQQPQQPQRPVYSQQDYDRHLQTARMQYPQIVITEESWVED
jgi:hypothetical protein